MIREGGRGRWTLRRAGCARLYGTSIRVSCATATSSRAAQQHVGVQYDLHLAQPPLPYRVREHQPSFGIRAPESPDHGGARESFLCHDVIGLHHEHHGLAQVGARFGEGGVLRVGARPRFDSGVKPLRRVSMHRSPFAGHMQPRLEDTTECACASSSPHDQAPASRTESPPGTMTEAGDRPSQQRVCLPNVAVSVKIVVV